MEENKFSPKPGQVDFSYARWCPVINCVVRYHEKILLVKRNEGMRWYPGLWNGISGFLDDQKSLREKVEEELREELGVDSTHIISMTRGEILNQEDTALHKTWIVHPVCVEIATDQIRLDWEATEFAWVTRDEISSYRLLPGFREVLEHALGENRAVYPL